MHTLTYLTRIFSIFAFDSSQKFLPLLAKGKEHSEIRHIKKVARFAAFLAFFLRFFRKSVQKLHYMVTLTSKSQHRTRG